MLDKEKRIAAGLIAKAACWKNGWLDFKRHATQKLIQKAIAGSTSRKFYLLCSRRLGKSYELVLQAFEMCLRKPGARVLYLAPYAKDCADIVNDLSAQILSDCPESLKPRINVQSKEIIWPNGSIIRLRGVNSESAQYLRGGAADLILGDEIGLWDHLLEVLTDVCLPMLITTDGRMILATTPALSPGHESAKVYEQLAAEGAASVFTLRDSPHITDDTKIEYLVESGETRDHATKVIKEGGLPKTTAAKREYFVQWVTDASSAVIPEFMDAEAEVVREYVRPEYFDAYVALDLGVRDRTAILFMYHDFIESKVVVEDEVMLHREAASTSGIAEAIKAKEAELWGFQKPYLRVSDVDLRLQIDLHTKYNIDVMSADKQNAIGAINSMRDMVRSRRLVILPKVQTLVRQCRNATWNSKASDFSRTELDGHYDAVSALRYGLRHINFTHNPWPAGMFARGGRFGVAQGAWVSPKNKKRGFSLHQDNAMTRRLRRGKK